MRLCKVEPLVLRDKTEVNGVAFSPDGERLASAGGDGTVKIWNSRTGTVIQSFPAHTDAVVSVAFHPDGRHLASPGADRTGEGLGLDGDRPAGVRPNRATPFASLGRRIPSRSVPPTADYSRRETDGEVRVWDWKNRQLLHTFPGHKYHSIPVAFSPDGRSWRRAAPGGKARSFGTWKQGNCSALCPRSSLSRQRAGVQPGRRAAGLGQLRQDRETVRIRRPAKSSSTFDCIPETSCASPSVRTAGALLRPAKTRRCASGTRRPAGRCSACAGTPTGAGAWRSARTAGASLRPAPTGPSASGTRPRSGGTRARKRLTFAEHSDEIRSVAFSPDGQDGLRFGRPRRAREGLGRGDRAGERSSSRGHKNSWPGLCLLRGLAPRRPAHRLGRRRRACDTVKVWDARTGREVFELPAGREQSPCRTTPWRSAPTAATWSRENSMGAVQVWDAETGQEVGTLGTHKREIRGVVFSRDGGTWLRRAATGW